MDSGVKNVSVLSHKLSMGPSEFQQFIDYYNEFEKHYLESSYCGHEETTECYMTFGVTGGGKSTTIARLLSNMKPSDFAKTLDSGRETNDQLVNINDVFISGAPMPTTVIPRVFTVSNGGLNGGPLHLCDMPGLRDTDAFKQMVTDVLYKCCLTRFKKTRYLIVVNVSRYNKRPKDIRLLLADHHYLLSKMFGPENYMKAINNFYFVFTHPDDRPIDNFYFGDLIKEALTFLRHYGDAPTPEELRFLSRISRRNITVNVNEDDNKTLLRNLQNLIKQDDQDSAGRSIPSAKHILSLKAGEDKLIQQCEYWLHEQLTLAEGERRKISEAERNFTENCGKWESNMDSSLQTDLEHHKGLGALREEQAKGQQRLDSFKSNIDTINTNKQILLDKLSINRRVLTIFDEDLSIADYITYHCELSREVPPAFVFGQPRYRLDMHAVLPTVDGHPGQWVALILQADRADAILTEDGLYLPPSLSSFERLRGDGVFFNSRNAYNPHNFVTKLIGNVFIMSVELDVKFHLYLFSSRKFATLPQHIKLRQDFEQPIEKFKEAIQECEKNHARRTKQNDQDLQRKIELKDEILAMITRCEASRTELKLRREEVGKQCQQIRAVLADIETSVKEMQTTKIKQVEEIGRILVANRIVASLTDLLQQFRMYNERSIADIVTLKGRVSAFEDKIAAKIEARKSMAILS